MHSFADLVASRRAWIDHELKPWCVRATVSQLKLAELEWLDIAGRVDAETTLWAWAWSRFPDLVNQDLNLIDESRQVHVTLQDGREFTGYPDARQSKQGQLVLLARAPGSPRSYADVGPFPLDEISTIKAVAT